MADALQLEPSEQSRRLKMVVLEDESLFLELLVVALSRFPEIDIVGTFHDGEHCLEAAPELAPDLALLDIEVPGGINGIEAGLRLRETMPNLGIVLLSNHKDPELISALRGGAMRGWAYVLKKTISNVEALMRAIKGAASGLVVLDPALVEAGDPLQSSAIERMTARQVQILKLIAQGYSNRGIAEALEVSVKTVENHINAIYEELNIPRDAAYFPRVRAVLAYLDLTDAR